MVKWLYTNGTEISCEEKIKVLDENLSEIEQMCRDALDDAVLIGCSEDCIKVIFRDLINNLQSNYRK